MSDGSDVITMEGGGDTNVAKRRTDKKPETKTSNGSSKTNASGSRGETRSSTKRANEKRKRPRAKRDDKAVLRWLTSSLEDMKRKRNRDRKSVCLPTCRNVTKFAVVYACVILLRSILGRCFEGLLENLEKLYKLKWPELEFILGVEKIGFAVSLLLIAYYGNGMHKPLAVLCGTFLCSIGSFICSVPHFLNNSTLVNETLSTDYFESGTFLMCSFILKKCHV